MSIHQVSLSKSTLPNSTVIYQSFSNLVSQKDWAQAILPSFEILFTCPLEFQTYWAFLPFVYYMDLPLLPSIESLYCPRTQLSRYDLDQFCGFKFHIYANYFKNMFSSTSPLLCKLTNSTAYWTASLRFQINISNLTCPKNEILPHLPIFPQLYSQAQ